MKNLIISLLATYIFWTDFCVLHPLPVLPVLFLLFWMILAGIDDLIEDFMKSLKRGRKLSNHIKRMKGVNN